MKSIDRKKQMNIAQSINLAEEGFNYANSPLQMFLLDMEDKFINRDMQASLKISWKDKLRDFERADKGMENRESIYSVECTVLDFRLNMFLNKTMQLRQHLSCPQIQLNPNGQKLNKQLHDSLAAGQDHPFLGENDQLSQLCKMSNYHLTQLVSQTIYKSAKDIGKMKLLMSISDY